MVKLREAETRMVGVSGWKEGEIASCCPTGVKFQLCKMNKFYRSAGEYSA